MNWHIDLQAVADELRSMNQRMTACNERLDRALEKIEQANQTAQTQQLLEAIFRPAAEVGV